MKILPSVALRDGLISVFDVWWTWMCGNCGCVNSSWVLDIICVYNSAVITDDEDRESPDYMKEGSEAGDNYNSIARFDTSAKVLYSCVL